MFKFFKNFSVTFIFFIVTICIGLGVLNSACTGSNVCDNQHSFEKTPSNFIKANFRVYVWEEEFHGHTYIFTANSGIHSPVNVVHSPNCKCFKDSIN